MTRDEESMAICAIRYTMGRRSYVVAEGQAWALKWGKKSKWVRDVIRRDLRDAINLCDQGTETLGDKMDEKGWRDVLYQLDLIHTQRTTTKVLMCDPPSGWKYGFPKPIPEERKNNFTPWLLEQGYPQKEIDSYGKHFYCRFWEEELEA